MSSTTEKSQTVANHTQSHEAVLFLTNTFCPASWLEIKSCFINTTTIMFVFYYIYKDDNFYEGLPNTKSVGQSIFNWINLHCKLWDRLPSFPHTANSITGYLLTFSSCAELDQPQNLYHISKYYRTFLCTLCKPECKL